MKQHSLGQAARAAGISLDYINVNGEKEAISDETLQALLAVMDDPQDAKKSPLPPVAVFSGSGKRQLTPQGSGVYRWQLQTEKGKQHSGELTAGEPFTLPGPLAQGYHQLTLSKGKKAGRRGLSSRRAAAICLRRWRRGKTLGCAGAALHRAL